MSQQAESLWPGEREPARDDVEAANEVPESTILSDFRRALLSSTSAKTAKGLMHLDLRAQPYQWQQFTYPATTLLDFPEIPTEDEVAFLQNTFYQCCTKHVFLGDLPLPQPSLAHVPLAPPLRLAIACLGSVHAGYGAAESRALFLASTKLWGVTMEGDNREARSPEMLMTSTLISAYGALTADASMSLNTAVSVCSSVTIARRMRFHDPEQLKQYLGPRAWSYGGPFIWSIWMIDVLHALHIGVGSGSFTSGELWTKMPSSHHDFQDVYRTLLGTRRNDGQDFLSDLSSKEDGILLLVAIMSDGMCMRKSLGQAVSSVAKSPTDDGTRPYNPFVPLSPQMELDRLHRALSSALATWQLTFHKHMPPEIMAFYHYVELYLSCRQLSDLPQMAQYNNRFPDGHTTHQRIEISDTSIRHAWLVLDFAAARAKSADPDALCPMWLPITVFHSSLVIWAKQCIDRVTEGTNNQYSSAKILLPFRVEIERMPWPCCREMASTLDRLMM